MQTATDSCVSIGGTRMANCVSIFCFGVEMGSHEDANTKGCLCAFFAEIRRYRSMSISLSNRSSPSSFNRSMNMDRRSDLAKNGKAPFHSGNVRT